jgi:broad specificity phosphatase PhoE
MILLVRHGEATHHTEHLTGGWTDSVLTEKGKNQMRFLAAKLAKILPGIELRQGYWQATLKELRIPHKLCGRAERKC